MASIHILTADERGNYRVVAHFAVPPGNNSAGLAWKSVLISDGLNASILQTPTIEQTELDSIIAGDIIEFIFTLNKLESGGGTDEAITQAVTQKVDEEKKRLARKYKHYGRTI